jgi:guanidinopropionase
VPNLGETSCPTERLKKIAAAIQGYWHWYGIATFMRCPLKLDMSDTDIGLIGFPYSGGNGIERMQYLGPRAVRDRAVAYCRSHRVFQVNPFSLLRISDLGDVPMPNILNPDLTARDAEAFYRRVDEHGIIPISVGGDHSVTSRSCAPLLVLSHAAGDRSG